MDPKSEDAEVHFRWWLRARDAYDADQLGVAMASIDRFRARAPDLAAGVLLHSMILTSLQRFDHAWPLIQQMLRWTKKPAVAHAIARFFDARNDVDTAAEWYRTRSTLEPASTVGFILLGAFQARRGRLIEAEATHRHATTLEGDPDEAFLNLAMVLRARGQFEDAIEAAGRAVALDPASATNAAVLADVNQALSLTRERLNPADRDRWWSRAVTGWGDRSRIGEAMVSIERHRQCDPGSVPGLLLHAEILTDLRRFDEAWKLLQQVQATLSWREHAVIDAVTRHLRLCGDLATAEEWRSRQCRDDPDSTRGFIGLAAVHAEQGRLSEAEASCRHATTLEGDRGEAYFQLGMMLRAQGNFGDASDALATAITLDPTDLRAAGVLADVKRAAMVVDAASPDDVPGSAGQSA